MRAAARLIRPAQAARNAATDDIPPGQELILEEDGLGVAMRGLHVGQHYVGKHCEFGRGRADVITMATGLRGPPTGSGRVPILRRLFRCLTVEYREKGCQ